MLSLRSRAAAGASVLAAIFLGACGGSSGSPGAPTTPSPLAVSIVASAPSGLMGATQLSFSLSGTGGGSYQCSWDFGDGSVGSGPTVNHVYDREGAFDVVATVTTPGSSATARTTVTVRSLAGTWRGDPSLFDLVLTQSNGEVGGTFRWMGFPPGTASGRVSHPSAVQILFLRGDQFRLEFTGTANTNVDAIAGTYLLCRAGGGGCTAPEAVTFRRQ